MTTTTRPPARPPRAQAPRPAAGSTEPGKGQGVLSLIGSLLLLLGVPAALIFLVGNPLPTTMPSRDWLTAQITPWLVIEILAALLWIVWIHFVVCFLTEWRAIRAGRMPDNVVMGGGSQLLARRLVAGILLLAGGASTVHGIGTAMASEAPQSSAIASSSLSALAGAAQGDGSLVDHSAGKHQAADVAQPGHGAKSGPLKMTTVKPPDGRHHDTAWGIAERTLGDGLRYKEIFDLNRDRLMPDGRRFTDADLIQPGWQLLLPADAKGADVHVVQDGSPAPGASIPTVPGSGSGHAKSGSGQQESGKSSDGSAGGSDSEAPSSAPMGTDRSALSSLADAAQAPGATGGTATTAKYGSDQGSSGLDDSTALRAASNENGFAGLGSILLGGGLILAGVARALTAKRGPFGDPDPAGIAVNSAANLVRAEFVDQALRLLAAQREREGLPLPEIRSAYVNDETLVVHLMSESAAPKAPWAQTDEQAWTIHRTDVAPVVVDVAAPYPSLVNVAETHGFDVLVDLEVAPGPISVAGDPVIARDLATAMALDLGTHDWSDEVQVFMVGFGDHLVDLEGGAASRTTAVRDIEELIAALGAEVDSQRSVLARLGVRGVLQGRQRGAVHECAPAVAFLSGPPSTEQAQRLAALTASGRTSLSVVIVGDSPVARWRFLVDGEGAFEAAALGLSGQARRFDPAAQQQLRRLLEQAAAERGAARREFEIASPAQAAAEAAVRHQPAARTAGELSDPMSAYAAAPVKVRLLGPVEVQGLARLEDSRRRAMLTEAIVMAALHPDGLHDAVLRASLWPRGVEDDVVAARIADVQSWLGLDNAGQPRLRTGADGRLHLSADVVSDYSGLVEASSRDSVPGITPDLELAGLLAGLRAGSGQAFSGDGRRYTWIAFAQESRRGRLIIATAARRAAELATYLRQPERAAEALEAGLRLVPAAEDLWRQLLRLRAQHDPDRVESSIDELFAALNANAVKPEAETSAIVVELSPDREHQIVS